MKENKEFTVQETNPYSAPDSLVVEPVVSLQTGRYAGFWIRFLAGFIDFVILSFLLMPFSFLFSILFTAETVTNTSKTLMAFAAFYGPYFLITWLYFGLQESSKAQATLGKRALGLVVTDRDGRRLGLGRASVRWAAHGLSNVTMLLGYLIQPFTPRKQAMHDFIAGTLVVHKINA